MIPEPVLFFGIGAVAGYIYARSERHVAHIWRGFLAITRLVPDGA